ncbi:hypothetical protein RhiirB3_448332 [Rhizophagus irregularis]|nr:hypothetical protein RhiirB3_448332 [Rhizophagus irregularis]
MSKTPCSVLNSKIRGKKVYLPDDDESLISTALSLVWTKMDKKIDSCTFEQDRDNLAELQHYKSLYELYKSKYELVLNHNVSLENKLQNWITKINNFCNNNSQTADIANSDSIIGELSYHKTNESVESNSPSQALPAVANKSDKLNVPPVANKNNELNSPPQVLPIANKSTDNESIKLNSSIQAPPVAVPEKVSVDSKITHIEIGRKSI